LLCFLLDFFIFFFLILIFILVPRLEMIGFGVVDAGLLEIGA